jgi:Putative 2OG-Fe(II) oxygenase
MAMSTQIGSREESCGEERHSIYDKDTAFHDGDYDLSLLFPPDEEWEMVVDHCAAQETEDPLHPPAYLMQAILAGLYELPPPHILKYQTGWGRRIRYHRVQHPTDCTMEYMTLQRHSHFQQVNGRYRATDCHEFDIYRVRFTNHPWWKDQLPRVALQMEQEQSDGIHVSNAGGTYHSWPNFFHSDDKVHRMFYRHIIQVVERMEQHQRAQQLYCSRENMERNRERTVPGQGTAPEFGSNGRQIDEILALEPKDIEGWVNISRTSGSWNRLHTHEGSAWSGVYYAASNSDHAWKGHLVLKPTPHPLEDTYTLTPVEQNRVRPSGHEDASFLSGTYKCTESPTGSLMDEACYLRIPPIVGDMIVFPSWLHHCVLPSSFDDPRRNSDELMPRQQQQSRISIAYNINWKH